MIAGDGFTVTVIQLTALLALILLAIGLVLLSWNWAEWSDERTRRRAGQPSRFARWRARWRQRRNPTVTVRLTADTSKFTAAMLKLRDAGKGFRP